MDNMKEYKYKAGQCVKFFNGTLPAASGIYEIVRLLPFQGGEFQYRIKSQQETYERVASESQLVFSS